MTTSSRKFNGYSKEEIGRRWEIDTKLSDKEFEAEFRRKVKENDPPLRRRIENDPEE